VTYNPRVMADPRAEFGEPPVSDGDAPDPHEAEVEALFALVRARYGERVTPAELAELRAIVAGSLERARALRAIRLDNGDEPAQPFRPFRADG
jgi:hypothetical protein